MDADCWIDKGKIRSWTSSAGVLYTLTYLKATERWTGTSAHLGVSEPLVQGQTSSWEKKRLSNSRTHNMLTLACRKQGYGARTVELKRWTTDGLPYKKRKAYCGAHLLLWERIMVRRWRRAEGCLDAGHLDLFCLVLTINSMSRILEKGRL